MKFSYKMQHNCVIFSLIILISAVNCVTIKLEDGSLNGTEEKDYQGNAYHCFKGIPYAKPPIGKLKFRAPQPPEPWKGIRDATKHQDKCSQPELLPTFEGIILGSDDCLYLNVYTKEDPRETNGKVKPVMVWIHGGAFVFGSGDSTDYGPDYLITEDVIIVTINYRLGISGFLRVDDPKLEIPGNAGLKDMVMALKWVQKNIGKFGGDANNVTIFGESAGAASVHMLILSPMAKGLFHQAILQSGSGISSWSLVPPDANPLRELAKVMDMEEKNDSEVIEALEKLSPKELIQTSMLIKLPVLFVPTVEKAVNEQTFLPAHPLNLIMSGNFNKVPVIFGYTSREGMLLAKTMVENIKEFEDISTITLSIPKDSKVNKEIAEKVGEFFYQGVKPSETNVDRTFMILTDIYFAYPILKSIIEMAKVNPEKMYLYRFSLDNPNVKFVKALLNVKTPGTSHADELPYQFKMEKVPVKVTPNSLEYLTIRRFSQLWANFAKYGDPNVKAESDLIPIEWKPVHGKRINYLEFGENLSVGANPDWKRFEFWDQIFTKLNQIGNA